MTAGCDLSGASPCFAHLLPYFPQLPSKHGDKNYSSKYWACILHSLLAGLNHGRIPIAGIPDGGTHPPAANLFAHRLTDFGGALYLRITLDSLLTELDSIDAQVQTLKEALRRETIRQGKGSTLNNLKTIPGVGPTVAQIFVAEIFRPERFERAEEICAHVGLAPIISQSGQKQGKAFLRQVGQNYFRSILVESAWTSVRRDKYFRDFYARIRSKTNLPQKAIVAVARKLLIIIWRVGVVENRVYTPVR